MKALIQALYFIAFASCAMATEKTIDWVSQPPEKLKDFEKQIPIKASDAYQVISSQFDAAVSKGLAASRVIGLTTEEAKKLAGPTYICQKGQKPFLLRAVYFNAGTGGFAVYRVGDAVWVTHESLGSRGEIHRSAMVVNLDFVPTTAYATASTAE